MTEKGERREHGEGIQLVKCQKKTEIRDDISKHSRIFSLLSHFTFKQIVDLNFIFFLNCLAQHSRPKIYFKEIVVGKPIYLMRSLYGITKEPEGCFCKV